jgi:bile acid:Na+ symporter, BASS family
MTAIDQIQLNFNPAALQALNLVLAVVMFGVALELRVGDFRRVLRAPLAPAIGLTSQFLLMPALATLIVALLKPAPSVALGIILVAACPGGNVSNFFTALARGNAALSVSMSAISTLFSVVMTPLNFMFWGRINPYTADLLRSIEISPAQTFFTVLAILIVPTLLGMATAYRRPDWAARLLRPMRILSVLFMLGFISAAMAANFRHFLDYIGVAFWVVLMVNAVALFLGYGVARLVRLQRRDARAVCFETGIQNSGFGLILVFNFFGGLGGMALIAAWWGVWHLVTGLGLALFWSRRDPQPAGAGTAGA